jgi:hypothetical protein
MSPKPPYYTQEELLAYLSGNLPSDKQEEIRMAAERDPFLKDALEGLSLDEYPAATIDGLRRRISKKPETAFPWIGVAAAVVIFAIFIPLGYYLIQHSPQKTDSITMVTPEETHSEDEPASERSEELMPPQEEPASIREEKAIAESPKPVPAQPRDSERFATVDETGTPDEDAVVISELRTAEAQKDETVPKGKGEERAENYFTEDRLDTDAVKPVAKEAEAGYEARKKELSKMQQYAVPGAATTTKLSPWKIKHVIEEQDTVANPANTYKLWTQWINELIDISAYESFQLIITSETHDKQPDVKIFGDASKGTADRVIKWVKVGFYLHLPELKGKSYTIDLEVYPQE